MTINKQLFGFGDGGVSTDVPLLDLHILASTGKKKPKVIFITDAAGGNSGYEHYFMKAFGRYPCEPSTFSTFSLPTSDFESYFSEFDVIYASGGNTLAAISLWRAYGLDKVFQKCYDNGTILAGGSAGFCCWMDEVITDSFPGSLTVMKSLGILPYSGCPHYSSRQRRKAYKTAIMDGKIKAGYAADDGAALHFVNGIWHKSVSILPHAKTFKVGMTADGQLEHQKLDTVYLRTHEAAEYFIWDTPTFRDLTKRRGDQEIPEADPTDPVLPQEETSL